MSVTTLNERDVSGKSTLIDPTSLRFTVYVKSLCPLILSSRAGRQPPPTASKSGNFLQLALDGAKGELTREQQPFQHISTHCSKAAMVFSGRSPAPEKESRD